MSETVVNYILVFMILEVFELRWQKAETMMGMLARMYQYYHKNIFLFFVMHPTFYLSIIFMIVSDYNIYALSIFLIKIVDIAMKIVLLKQVFIDKEISHELTVALLSPIPKMLPYIGLSLYPFLVYLALA